MDVLIDLYLCIVFGSSTDLLYQLDLELLIIPPSLSRFTLVKME